MVLYLDILVPALIALIPGLVIHSFIIVINVTDWWKGRSVTPVDQIITSLGISRMCIQCHIPVYEFVIDHFLYSPVVDVLMNVIFAAFYFTNIWLTSLLSIVFCLKISNLRTRLFLYLRRMIEQRTVHFIVGSVLLSTLHSFLLLSEESEGGKSNNSTIKNPLKDCGFNTYLYSHTIMAIIPMLFYYISSVLLFTSLYRHITKMKMSGNLSINLEAYYSAMTFVSITFIYSTIYFTIHYLDILYYYLFCKEIAWLDIVLGFLLAVHSSYLIYRTAKLRSQMSKVVQNIIDFLFQRKDPETREDIEVVAQ